MKIFKKKLKELTEKFETEYSSNRLDFNEVCIRADVIRAIHEDLGEKINTDVINKLYNMESRESSIKFLKYIKERYAQQMKKPWLLDLLIELQKVSINTYNEFISKGQNPYELLNSLLGQMNVNSVTK